MVKKLKQRPRGRLWDGRVDAFHLGVQLDGLQIIQAKQDVMQSNLKNREKDILLKIIEGVKASELADTYQLPRSNIYHLHKTALVKIWRELGPRDWIRIESKGMIEEWALLFPLSLTS